MTRGLRFTSPAAIGDPRLREAAERAMQQSAPVRALPAPPKKRRDYDAEFREAKALMEMVQAHIADCPQLDLFHAIPNGGRRGKASAGRAKAEGARAGVCDYFLPTARQGFHGLYIELKTLEGAPSREQRDFIQDVRDEGYRAEVCRGWEAAWRVLCDYLGLKVSP